MSDCSVVLCGTVRCPCQLWTRWHERQEDGSLVERVAEIEQVACEECRIWYRAFEGEESTCPCCVARAELKALKESR